MKRLIISLALAGLLLKSSAQQRIAPAYPLLTHDPYFSVWSFTDGLNTSATKHWTGASQSLIGLVKVDGKVYRFLGGQEESYQTVLPASDEKVYTAKYVESAPGKGWDQAGFSDSGWKTGTAPFGDGAATTQWRTKDLWMRRTFNLEQTDFKGLKLKLMNDDDVEVYLNGTRIFTCECFNGKFIYVPVDTKILKKGENLLAVHVKNNVGGQWLDAGLVYDKPAAGTPDVLLAKQTKIRLSATQTSYNFDCGNVNLDVDFASPLLMNDLDLLSRPVSYVSFKLKSKDGKKHNAEVYFGASTGLAVNTEFQEVIARQYKTGQLSVLKAGTKEQAVLKKRGDDVRIDWGYLYVAAPDNTQAKQFIAPADEALVAFTTGRTIGKTSTGGKKLMLSTVLPFNQIGTSPVEKYILIGYDDLYAVCSILVRI
ncbi:DUF5127 domain-containing protein [Pedobacter sp. NJ-S-72]